MNLCFSMFRRNFSVSALFEQLSAVKIEQNKKKFLHKVLGTRLLVFTTNDLAPFLRFRRNVNGE